MRHQNMKPDTSVKTLSVNGQVMLRYCKPVKRDLTAAKNIADRLAYDQLPQGFWAGVVTDTGYCYDITFTRRRPSADTE